MVCISRTSRTLNNCNLKLTPPLYFGGVSYTWLSVGTGLVQLLLPHGFVRTTSRNPKTQNSFQNHYQVKPKSALELFRITNDMYHNCFSYAVN